MEAVLEHLKVVPVPWLVVSEKKPAAAKAPKTPKQPAAGVV